MLITTTQKSPNVNIVRSLVTDTGVVRCRYDMMIRFPDDMIRFTSNPFTERGDRFEKLDTNKMLVHLVKYITNKRHKERWIRAELYDTSKPPETEQRIILKYERGEIKINLLANYQTCFEQARYVLPEWLCAEDKNELNR